MSMRLYEIYNSIEDYMYVKTKDGFIRLPLTTKEITGPFRYSIDTFDFPKITLTSEFQVEDFPETKDASLRSPVSRIKKVIFNDPATIVLWRDGTKTVVKCQDDDAYDKMTGLAMCISKKFLGNNGRYYDLFKKYIDEVDK